MMKVPFENVRLEVMRVQVGVLQKKKKVVGLIFVSLEMCREKCNM
jgi:hypothetical protein